MTRQTPHTPHRKAPQRLLAVLAALALIAAACSSSADDPISLSDGGFAEPAPSQTEVDVDATSESDFSYATPEGQTVEFADLTDGPVVINFFASWCPSCIAEMPDFESVHQDFATEVEFLGLAMQDRTESAVELVAETGVTYPIGLDPEGDIFAQFGGLGMPTTVFVAADGTITNVHSGQLTAEQLADIINDDLLS